MKNILKVTLALSLIFGATYTNAQERIHHKKMHHETKEERVNQYFEQLKRELNLTEAQESQMRGVFKEKQERLISQRPSKDEVAEMDEAARKEAKMERMKLNKEINEEMKEKIAEILNEEQLVKYGEMTKERKLEVKERHQERKMHGEREHRMKDAGDMHQHEDGTEHKH